MFIQIAIVAMGLFLVVTGLTNGNYLNVGIGALVAVFAGTTLYKLKTGK